MCVCVCVCQWGNQGGDEPLTRPPLPQYGQYYIVMHNVPTLWFIYILSLIIFQLSIIYHMIIYNYFNTLIYCPYLMRL